MPVVERIELDGVDGLRVGRFPGQINTTCWVWRLGDTLVDTGPPNQWSEVRRFLAERETRRVVVTHHHEDHSGNLARIARDPGLEAMAPEASLAPLATGYEVQIYRWLIWGRPENVRVDPLPPRLDLGGGQSLEPVPAPGHSPDMTCLLEPSMGRLFAGDLFIAARTRYLRADENIHEQIRSLRRIAQLDFEVLFCGHRGVVKEGREAIGRKLDFLVSFREKVRDLHRTGRSARQITRRLLGREDHLAWVTRGHFSRINLVRACLSPIDEEERSS